MGEAPNCGRSKSSWPIDDYLPAEQQRRAEQPERTPERDESHNRARANARSFRESVSAADGLMVRRYDGRPEPERKK